jgi:DNA-binding transcriptional MerR regulator
MLSIGDFARLGRVSVRMLRHYDAIGLLCPAAVDPASGYRFYHADQLRRLNRVIALKDLGFTFQQVGRRAQAQGRWGTARDCGGRRRQVGPARASGDGAGQVPGRAGAGMARGPADRRASVGSRACRPR